MSMAAWLDVLRDVAPIALLLVAGFAWLGLRPKAPYALVRGFLFMLVGMGLFLVGLDQGVFPLGEAMARKLTDPAHVGDHGRLWIYLFGFAVGMATTIAEPALIAVGMKAEEVSKGVISAWGLRWAVAFGVGVGVALGCHRLLAGHSLVGYILGAYALVLVQTLFAPRKIVPIAYDSGGVTTSTVTVPLLAALGIGLAKAIPGRDPFADGFGLIAFASVFPIISVLGYAQLAALRARLRAHGLPPKR